MENFTGLLGSFAVFTQEKHFDALSATCSTWSEMETQKSHQKLESFSQRKNCNKSLTFPLHSNCIISHQFFYGSSPFFTSKSKTSGKNLKNQPFEPENHLPNPPFLGIFMAIVLKGCFFFPPRHVVQSYNSSTLAPCAVRRAGAVVLCPDRSSRCNDPRRPWCHRCHGDAVVIPRHSFGRPSRCPTNEKWKGWR